jgi:hypothetical protein
MPKRANSQEMHLSYVLLQKCGGLVQQLAMAYPFVCAPYANQTGQSGMKVERRPHGNYLDEKPKRPARWSVSGHGP